MRFYPLETVNVERLLVVVLGQLDGGAPIGIRRIDALLHLQLGGIRVCGGDMNERLQSLPSQRQLDKLMRATCVHQNGIAQRIIEAVEEWRANC